jgi:ribonuclease HI
MRAGQTAGLYEDRPHQYARAQFGAGPVSRVEIDTDGACKRNPDGPGGWGVVWSSGRHRKELHGGSSSTTNNRMELTAVIEALNALRGPSEV